MTQHSSTAHQHGMLCFAVKVFVSIEFSRRLAHRICHFHTNPWRVLLVVQADKSDRAFSVLHDSID
jgi:hypothetical protein